MLQEERRKGKVVILLLEGGLSIGYMNGLATEQSI